MDYPVLNPNLSANINDESMIDDSIKQDGINITAGAGSVINSNSGNGKRNKTSASAVFQSLVLSLLCDIIVCGFVYFHGNSNKQELNDKIGKMEVQVCKIVENTEKSLNSAQGCAKESKEGIIWILRRDILNSIDFHETKMEITAKQYKRIKDQFDYYKSIGGNHDVESRFDDFNSKVFGTGQVKMTAGH